MNVAECRTSRYPTEANNFFCDLLWVTSGTTAINFSHNVLYLLFKTGGKDIGVYT